jgi:hypothetical protein
LKNKILWFLHQLKILLKNQEIIKVNLHLINLVIAMEIEDKQYLVRIQVYQISWEKVKSIPIQKKEHNT